MEVVTLTEDKIAILKNIFWKMNTITHKVISKKVVEKNETTETEKTTEKPKIKTVKTLYITTTGKSAEEMIQQYRFNIEQVKQLEMLLDSSMNGMWNSLLYGSSSGGTLVEIAENEYQQYVSENTVGGAKYINWYNEKYETAYGTSTSWCAIFVSWCAEQGGYLESGTMYSTAGAGTHAREFYASNEQWHRKTKSPDYIPQPGDLILFRWYSSGYSDEYHSDHIGIVVEVKDGLVYTVEGNASNQIKRLSYSLTSSSINGYCSPGF